MVSTPSTPRKVSKVWRYPKKYGKFGKKVVSKWGSWICKGKPNKKYHHRTIPHAVTSRITACAKLCFAEKGCTFWTLKKWNNACYFYTCNRTEPIPTRNCSLNKDPINKGYIGGFRECATGNFNPT